MSDGKKKLSGYQNLIKKRKRKEVLENTNKKITKFFKAPIDSTSEASVKNDDNMEPSTSRLVEVEETVTFIEADEVFDSKTVQLSEGESKRATILLKYVAATEWPATLPAITARLCNIA
ncbi:hypothetical protein JTB14_022394 [Gonioctena quinquepunctata]|nr:hypothetical protein JTB14_022394 [Gonioctena quinquepunctata]